MNHRYNLSQFNQITAPNSLFILIDLSWHSYRGYHTHRDLTTLKNGAEVCSGHVYAVSKTVIQVKKRFPNAIIVLVRDGATNPRKLENPNYKSTRSSLPFDIHCDCAEMAVMCCSIPNVYTSYSHNLEADDLLYTIARSVITTNGAKKAIIYTGDQDLLQTVSPQIYCLKKWDGDRDKCLPLMGMDYVIQEYGVDVSMLPAYRAVCGDSSDNLPGIMRFNRPFLRNWLNHCQSFERMFDSLPSPLPFGTPLSTAKKYHALLLEHRDLLEENYRMMKLEEKPDIVIERSVNVMAQQGLIKSWKLRSLEDFLMRFSDNDTVSF